MRPVTMTHIELDENGVAWIRDANTKVIEVVQDKLAWGWEPDEIQANHPHLTLGEIYAAFAYYYDHQAELDADIERRYRAVEELRAKSPNKLSRQQLLARAEAKNVKLGNSE